MKQIYIWQRIVSPHVAGLAVALAAKGYDVTYVAEDVMSIERATQGWQPPELVGVRLVMAQTAKAMVRVVQNANPNSIHICQGIRGNGLVCSAQKALVSRGIQQWIVMETVDDHGLFGVVKRAVYRWLFWRKRKQIWGVLAIGWTTQKWVVARGFDPKRVFPFAYFLPDIPETLIQSVSESKYFRFIFVGQLIKRKRVDLLIESLSKIHDESFELIIVGDGPCKKEYQLIAQKKLTRHVRWLGQLPISQILQKVCDADCLILPSQHDGWGAVVSEALLVGTPVICSDACGSASVVRASCIGGVFAKNDSPMLEAQIYQMLKRGRISPIERQRLAVWARSLGASAGAKYLSEIITYQFQSGHRPQPPWHNHLERMTYEITH